MRYLILLSFVALLSGCMSDDWRAAIAQERVLMAENTQRAQEAQIERGQSADSDRRNAQTRLEALQAQQSIVAGQAMVANAGAQTAIVMSNNETLLLVAEQIVQATRPDYTPLYAGMTGMVVVIVVWMLANARRPVQAATVAPPAPTRVVYQSAHACAWQRPDGTIILRRLADGCERVYTPGDEFYGKLMGEG